MSRPAQASTGRPVPGIRCARRAPAILPVCFLLCGCVSSVLAPSDGVDRSIVTGAIPPPAAVSADPEDASDETTIRNAVSSVPAAEMSGGRIPWANPGTGSRGEITEVREYRVGAALCRGFVATRESYAGVALHSGEACLESGGGWRMRSFGAG